MDINISTIIITLLNLIIFIAIPIGVVIFMVKIVKNQRKIMSDIELLNNRLDKLESK